MPLLFTSFMGGAGGGGGSGGGLGDYFANIGATGPFYSHTTYPTAFQDSAGKTRLFFEAWSGARRILRTIALNHSSGLFGQYRGVAIGLLTDDEHGVPAACEDSSGYIHVFGNAHNSDLFHYGSANDVATEADPTYRLRHTFTEDLSYAIPVAVGAGLFLLSREFVGSGKYTGVMFQTTALSGGVPTWGAKTTIVDFGTARVYFGNALLVGTDIHLVATRADSSDTERKGVYYFVIDTATGDISNFAGTTTVAFASLPVDLATSDSDFRLVDHGSNRGSIPYLAFDSNGDPHITYVDGSGTGFEFKHIMHDGSSWTSAVTISPITGQVGIGFVGTCAIVRLSGGEVAFHYPDNSGGLYRGEAGNWKSRTRSAAGVLSSEETILTAGTAKIGRMTTPVNPHADLRVFATEIAASANDADAGGLRVYGHGDSGLIGPPVIVLDATASALISGFAVQPSLERKLAINDLIVRLKGSTIWAKLDALWMMAAHDAGAALVNWKNPGAHDLTLHGTANPSFTVDGGYTTDGVDNYLDTNFNPATAGGNYSQNSAMFGIWSGTSGKSNASEAGWFDGSDGVTINPRNESATGKMQMRLNQASAAESADVVSDGSGFFAANRSGASAIQGYRNGSSLISASNASTALNSANLRLGSITAASFAAMIFRAAALGASLSSTEQADLYNFMLEYLRQVGAES